MSVRWLLSISIAGLAAMAAGGVALGAEENHCVQGNDPLRPFGAMTEVCKDLQSKAVKGHPKPPNGLGQWSAGVKEIKAAPCLRLNPFSEDEMMASLDADVAAHHGSESRVINGVSFTDENPRLLDLFEKLTTYKDFDAPDHPEKQRRFTSACTKVMCAVKELLGPKVAVQSLFALSRFGYNPSPYVLSDTVPWRPEQLDTVLLGLAAYPPHSLPIEDNHPLAHLSHGQGDGHTIANAMVTVFDAWDKLPPEERLMTIVHELGHNFASHAGNIDGSKKWLELSGWTSQPALGLSGHVEDFWESKKKEATVSEYGQSNPSEDFAESVAAYRLNGAWLKKRSPEKFDLLKELVFDGLDYLSESGCKDRQGDSERLAAAAVKRLDDAGTTIAPELAHEVAVQCGAVALGAVGEAERNGQARASSVAALDRCVGLAVGGAAVQKEAEGQFQYPEFTIPLVAERARLSAPEESATAARAAFDQELRKRLASLLAHAESGNTYRLLALEKTDEPSVPDWCQTVATDALSTAEIEKLGDAFSRGDTLFTYNHRDELSTLLKKECLAAHLGRYPIAPLDAAKASARLAGLPAAAAVESEAGSYGTEGSPRIDGLQAHVRAACDTALLERRFSDYQSCVATAGLSTYGQPAPDWAKAAAEKESRTKLEAILVKAMRNNDDGRSYLRGQKLAPGPYCEQFPGGYPQGDFVSAGLDERNGYPQFYATNHAAELEALMKRLCLRIEALGGGNTATPMSEPRVKQAVRELLSPAQ